MIEMNRREYLKQLGVAAAAAIGTNHLARQCTMAATSSDDNAHSVNNRYDSYHAMAIQATGHWPIGTKPDPAVFGVKLIFTGMLIFGYKGTEARVAFHRGHTDTHKMRIIVAEKIATAEECSQIYTIGDGHVPADIRDLEVGIKGKPSNVNFFLGDNFNREANTGDALDFRWLIDLEGPDGYRRELPKTDRKFTAKMKVKHGTFYTYQRTNATFVGEGGPLNGKKFGHVAKVMATNIGPLNDGESVYLRINGCDVLPYPLTNRAKYEIYFFNERETGDDPDFDMVFDAFQIDAGEKFSLVRATPGKEEETTDLCINLPIDKAATDEAPCMGVGFSSGKGFP
ncbi:MAG TPA: hypothetical protein VFR78_13675 [Pyrinomonadaceae bacterium]|nr:hypothetical protein [Pyrinomonadaceae bacterium]